MDVRWTGLRGVASKPAPLTAACLRQAGESRHAEKLSVYFGGAEGLATAHP